MKFFTKVALVSAMAISANAMAAQLQALDEEELSATTGQDGITITLNTTASGIDIANLYLHDKDGLGAGTAAVIDNTDPLNPVVTTPASWEYGLGGTGSDGAIGIHGVNLSTVNGSGVAIAGALAKVRIDTDGGADAANTSDDAFLNVNVELPNSIKISLDAITVGASNDTITGARRGIKALTNEVVVGQGNKIVSGYTDTDQLSVVVGGSKLNIQLGNAPQGAFIKASGTVTGGLSISNVAVVDSSVSGGGVIGIDNIKVTDAGSANLTADASISLINTGVDNSGLAITLGSTAQDVYLTDVRLGGNFTTTAGAAATNRSDASTVGTANFTKAHIASIGDVELQGLNLNATSVIISGH